MVKFKDFKDINRPQAKVAELFADPAYLNEYQDGFVKKVLVSGTAGQAGAISKMYYQQGKQEMELTETIITNQLPDFFEAHYHHKHMDNTMKCTFIKLNEQQTRYEYEYEYTRMSWIMPRLIAILFPSVYRKQVEKWMINFKTFVEQQ